LPIIIKFKAQVELKEMKEGASITVASSYENVHKERGRTKFKERRKLKEMKKGALIAIINSFENN
jgi:TusA-related sulfurtransferase